MQTGFYKSRPIAADILGYLIAAFVGSGRVGPAANAAAPFAGITDSVGGQVAHGLVDVQLSEEADVRFGGPVAAGDPLMAAADGTGRAVKLVKPAAGAFATCIGFAQVDGVADDVGKVFLSPHVVAG